MSLELYIHIPFCLRKCSYCDFLSFKAGREAQRQYADALIAEIISRGKACKGETVSSIFFGGGTPSILPAEWIEEILSAAGTAFSIEEDAEISMEANPGTVDAEKLTVYRRAGINRLSFGCQSAEDEELRMLGRIHTWQEFLDSFREARAVGFDNINVDLMSALPGQSAASWEKTLRRVTELGPEHISAYSLILEEGTPLFQNQEQYTFPDEDEERLMYERTHVILEEYGFVQYEISNYSLPGRECRHNLGYWTGTGYLGLGLGASSYKDQRRFSNTRVMDDYIRLAAQPELLEREVELLTEEDRISERLILGLRLRQGVSEAAFEKEFHRSLTEVFGSVIDKYMGWGLLEWEKGSLRLTREGISVSNTVMAEFLL